MLEIEHPRERIVREGLDRSLLRKKGNAKTFPGRLLSMLQKARKDKNFETAMFLQEIYHIYQEYTPSKINSVELIGWKGKDQIEIFKDFENDFRIIEHRKNKEGEVEKIYKEIPKENVNDMKHLLFSKIQKNEAMFYSDVARLLMLKHGLKIPLDSFNGGKNRAQYYFPLYYYPIKILEAMQIIKYSARGKITRIK